MLKKSKCNPLWYISTATVKIYLLLGLLVRIVFMLLPPEGSSFSWGEVVKLLCLGFVNDLCVGIMLCLPLLLVYVGQFDAKYKKVPGMLILALLVAGVGYVGFTHSIFHDYGGGAPRIALGILLYKLVSFSLRFFIPAIRKGWRLVSYYVIWAVYLFLLLCNGVGEWFFWDEFGVRYNFIAVDYLVYTHEVIGNIMESYAIVPLLILMGLLTAAVMWLTSRRRGLLQVRPFTVRGLISHAAVLLVLSGLAFVQLTKVSPRLEGNNLCVNQLQQNGIYDFVEAFFRHQLEYDKFYAMLPEDECRQEWRSLCALDSRAEADTIAANWTEYFAMPEKGVNVVLITVESLSASFFEAYGNEEGITPCLDSLMGQSMVFDNLYAVGNRTVRGLEALSLCVPPCAGESVVKQPDNQMGDMSVGAQLKHQGYQVQFLYGGDSYFDNMGDYFGNNGYEVIDRQQMNPDSIVFANIWGVSDEDLYGKALSVFDGNQRPFFAQIMTTSNHRPYTFPEGRIAFEGNTKCRSAAVKYTDYAIGHFLREAAKRDWFDHTLFVIIADHCASSAGKTSIPVDKYHIPCIVYAPKLVKPFRIGKLCSQIDIMPTLFSMLHMDMPATFAGRNVLAEGFQERAFMATYQDLGYLEGDRLTVLSPNRKVRQYQVAAQGDGTHTENLLPQADDQQVRRATVYYQYSNLYLNE